VRYSVRSSTAWAAEYAHYDEPDNYQAGTPTPGFVLDGAGTPHTLYDIPFNDDPHSTRITLAKRTSQGWQETVLAEDARWGPGSALAMDVQGRAHIVTQSTEGLLRLIRWDTGAPAPLGGGRNGRVQAPMGFSVQLSTAGLKCAWQDRAENETGYRLFGATSPAGPYSPIVELGPDAVSFLEPLPPTSRAYRYVAARNAGGLAFSAMASTDQGLSDPPTAPGKPTIAVAPASTSIDWRWADSPDEDYYQIRTSSDVMLQNGIPANTLTFIDSILGPNSGRTVRVLAYKADGAFASSPSSDEIFTKANPPSGTAALLAGNRVTLAWGGNLNPAYTEYFAYLSTNDKNYTLIASTNTTGTNAQTNALAPGVKYWFRVSAKSAHKDYALARYWTHASTLSLTVPPSGTTATVRVEPSLSFDFAGPVPEGSFILQEELTDTLPSPSAPWRLVGTPQRVETDSEEGWPLTATPVGGNPGASLAASRWDEVSRTWIILSPGSASPPGIYALLGATPATPDGLRVFPNPFRPARGQTEVTIADVPAGSRVSLYTLSGDRVWEREAGSDGTVTWTGVNASGRPVASGIFLGVAEKDGNRKTFRVAVEQ
jgi:hypothetical protein